MNAAKWLIIPIEVQIRELESRFLLAQAAASRGYRVVIGEQGCIHQNLHRLPRGVIYEKSVAARRVAHLQRVRDLGFRVVASDEETNLVYADAERFNKERLSEETLPLTDIFFCWSEMQKELCSSAYPNFKERFTVTGTNRVDIWRPEFSTIFQDQVSEIRRRHGRFILFNSNFGSIIHWTGPGYNMRVLVEGGIDSPEMVAKIEKMNAQELPNLEAFTEALPKIHQRFPEHRIIIRPHPADDQSYWRKACRGLNRARVILDGAVTPWLLASDAMFHHGCTTGVEATILGARHVMYTPHPDDFHDNHIGGSGAPRAQSADELLELLSRTIEGDPELAPEVEALSPYFASLVGKTFAFETMMDRIEELDVAPSEATPDLLSGEIPFAKRQSGFTRMIRYIKGKPQRKTPERKFPGVPKESLDRLAGMFSEASDALRPPIIRTVNPLIFELQPAE